MDLESVVETGRWIVGLGWSNCDSGQSADGEAKVHETVTNKIRHQLAVVVDDNAHMFNLLLLVLMSSCFVYEMRYMYVSAYMKIIKL